MKLLKRPLQVLRLLHINLILFRHQLDAIVFSTGALRSFSFLSTLNPWRWLGKKEEARGKSIRIALEELGPVFIKFGQILSTRPDLLPEDIVNELEKLQDQVPSFSGDLAKKILEEEYKNPVEKIFAHFDSTPLASASIAQVHAATLTNGKSVVVKIVRPGIQKIISRDIGLLHSIATLTEKIFPDEKRLKAREIVAEAERSMLYELDLLHEGANASQLRRNFLNSPLLYVPEVFWDYSSNKVLVMERINGIPISDIITLKEYGIDLKRLAEKGVEIFFTQVLRDNFFHADMHPGNIFISKENIPYPKYIAVDFGIMGTLSPLDQRYLAENLLAFFKRDYRRVAELHIESGWVKKVRIDEFETVIRGVAEPIFERPLKDISFGRLFLKLFQAARQFQMEIQPQFFLLQKTLINIEGLGRQLYPDLDLWSTAKPYLEKWVKKQFNPLRLVHKIYQHSPALVDTLLELPNMIKKFATEEKRDKDTSSIDKKLNRKKWLGIGLGLVTVAILNYVLSYTVTDKQHLVNLIAGVIGIILIIRFLT
jgi:ubiquinone biosynthesis protein